MITQEDMNLLVDLAVLVKKYGSDSFERLKVLLNSGELSGLLEGTFELTKEEKFQNVINRRSSRSHRTATVKQKLNSIMDSQPEKFGILSQFYSTAKAKRILASRREAFDFAVKIGLRPSKEADRESIISAITRRLVSLPVAQIRNLLIEANRGARAEEGLEDWANIIFGKKLVQKDFPEPVE